MNAIPDFEQMLKIGLDAVADACKVTRHVQSQLDRIKQATKDDRSPVTVADYAAQAVVASRLQTNLGELKMVGEEDARDLRENSATHLRAAVVESAQMILADAQPESVLDAIDLGNHDGSAESYWTLDPIDGTKGFLRGGQYAVSLAYIVRGQVVLGVLGCPNLSADFERPFDDPDPSGTLFHALRGEHSWVRPASDPGCKPSRIKTSEEANADAIRLCESVEAGHSKLDDSQRILAHLGGRGKPARLDSQCKYAVVARGQADAYLRLPTRADYTEKIWDHAAGMIIAEEAGARVTDVHGRDLDFSHGALLTQNRGVICAPRGIHRRLISAVEELGLFPQ